MASTSVDVKVVVSSGFTNFKVYSPSAYGGREKKSASYSGPAHRYDFCLNEYFVREISEVANGQKLLPIGDWHHVLPIEEPSALVAGQQLFLSVRLHDDLNWDYLRTEKGAKYFKGSGLEACLLLPALTKVVSVPKEQLLEAIAEEKVESLFDEAIADIVRQVYGSTRDLTNAEVGLVQVSQNDNSRKPTGLRFVLDGPGISAAEATMVLQKIQEAALDVLKEHAAWTSQWETVADQAYKLVKWQAESMAASLKELRKAMAVIDDLQAQMDALTDEQTPELESK